MFQDSKLARRALILGSLWLAGCSGSQSFDNGTIGAQSQSLNQLNALEQFSTGASGDYVAGEFLVEVDYTRLEGIANLQFQAVQPDIACAPVPVAATNICATPAIICNNSDCGIVPPPCLPTPPPPPPCQINGDELAVLYGQGDVLAELTPVATGTGSGSAGSGSAGSSANSTANASSALSVLGLNLTTSFRVDDATAQACLTTAANALALNHSLKITGSAVILPFYGITLPPNLNYNAGDLTGGLGVAVPSIATGENILDGTLPPSLPPFRSLDTVVIFNSIATCVDTGTIVIDPPPPPAPVPTAIPVTAAQ